MLEMVEVEEEEIKSKEKLTEEEFNALMYILQAKGMEELGQEELKRLVAKTLKQGNNESGFILMLSEWNRPGSGFSDWGVIKLIYGEIEKIELENYYDYPTTNETVYAILPKSKIVVILHQSGDDYQGEFQEHQTLYVFTYDTGWKSISLS